MKTYQPIDCDCHSQYELYCMHHDFLEITLKDFTFKGIAKDIVIKDKAEFLSLEIAKGKTTDIRLDTIIKVKKG